MRARKGQEPEDISSLARTLGFVDLDKSDVSNVKDFLPTFIPKVDALLGGGIPLSNMSEVFAPEQVGKSTFMLYLTKVATALGVYVLWVDVEGTTGSARMNQLDIHGDNIKIFNPASLGVGHDLVIEDIARVIDKFLTAYNDNPEVFNKQPAIIIWDSIGASISAAEDKLEYGKEGQRGRNAKAITDLVKKVTPKLSKANVALIAINQVRANQNMRSPYDKKWIRPGAVALDHWERLRLELRKSKQIKGIYGEGKDAYAGHILRILTDKSKDGTPHHEASVGMLSNYQVGVDPDIILNGVDYAYALYLNGVDLGLITTKGSYKLFTTQSGTVIHKYERDMLCDLKQNKKLLTDLFTQCMLKTFPKSYAPIANRTIDVSKWPYFTKALADFYKKNMNKDKENHKNS